MFAIQCTACQCTVTSRGHYRSKWHLFNTKRAIGGKDPVTFPAFESLEARRLEGAPKIHFKCTVCNKLFKTEATCTQHLNSKKHNKNVRRLEISKREEIVKTILVHTKDDISSTCVPLGSVKEGQCIFCPTEFQREEQMLTHMECVHGFVIPSKHAIRDLQSLMKHFHQSMTIEGRCPTCDRAFTSLSALREHMTALGHLSATMFEGSPMLKYYDFSSSRGSGSRCVSFISSDGELIMSDGTGILKRGARKKPPKGRMNRIQAIALGNGSNSNPSTAAICVSQKPIRLRGDCQNVSLDVYRNYNSAVQVQYSTFQHRQSERKHAKDRAKRVKSSMISKIPLAVVKKLCSAERKQTGHRWVKWY